MREFFNICADCSGDKPEEWPVMTRSGGLMTRVCNGCGSVQVLVDGGWRWLHECRVMWGPE